MSVSGPDNRSEETVPNPRSAPPLDSQSEEQTFDAEQISDELYAHDPE